MKKTNKKQRNNFNFLYGVFSCFMSIMLIGILMVVLLTPNGDHPAEWFLNSWLELLNRSNIL